MSNNHQTTGQRIRTARDKQGKTQRAVAILAGITNVQLCRIERDQVDAKHETLKRIAKILRLKLEDL